MSDGIDVLGLGCLAWDEIVLVREYPAENQKAPLQSRYERIGGTAGTALRAAARYGAAAAWAGTIGEDEASTRVLGALTADGVDLAHARRDATAGVIKTIVIVNTRRQTRTVFYDLGAAVPCAEDWPSDEVIRNAKVLLVDQFGVEGMLRAAKIAVQAGKPIVADFESSEHFDFDELMGMVDHLILSDTFACELTGASDPAAAVSRLWNERRQAVVVTCGEKGCWYRGSENPAWASFHFPAPFVETTDTTGCGDVFHGVYAATLAEGRSLEERLRRATAAAAIKAQRPAGDDALPRRADIETFLETFPA